MELVGSIFTAPRAAFLELRERPRWLLPLLALLVGTVGVMAWYYATVDIAWLGEHVIDNAARQRPMPEAARTKALATMTRPVMMGSALVATTLFLLLARVLEAGYFSLAGKITNVQYSYRHWLALAWWSGLPHVLSILVVAGYLLVAPTTQIAAEDLQLLSLNELFFHRSAGEPGYTLLVSITLLHPWVWALTVIGVRAWSGRSLLFSTVFGLLPTALVYAGWALFAFR